MAKADSGRVQISYLKQAEKGVIPNEAFQAIRHTGGSFGIPQQTERSESVRSGAQRSGAIRVGIDPEATINLELTAKVFDDLIAGLMRDDWSDAVDVSDAGISADNEGSKFTGYDWDNENIVSGQWVHVSGFETAGANGWFKVESIDGNDLVVSPAPEDDTNTGSKTIKVQGSYVRNGTDTPYFAMQCEHQDLDKIRLIKDARIGQMNLNVNSRSKVTGSLQVVGADFDLPETKAGNGNVNDAPEREILNTSSHLAGIFINGDLFDGDIMEFSLATNMHPRRQNAVGKVTSADIGLGSLEATGSMSIYLTGTTWDDLLVKYKGFEKISIAFAFEDSAGHGYVFELPKIALTNEPGNIPGPDQDVMLSFDFAAEPGSIGEETKTMQISKRQAA